MKLNGLFSTLKVQGLIGLIAIAMFALLDGLSSALYGFFIGMVNLLVLGLTFSQADKKSAEDPKLGVIILYMSAVVRFILLAVLFVLGLSLFKFEAMPVVLTFVLMQLGQVFNLAGKRRLTD